MKTRDVVDTIIIILFCGNLKTQTRQKSVASWNSLTQNALMVVGHKINDFVSVMFLILQWLGL